MEGLNPGPQQQAQQKILTDQQVAQMHDLAEALQKNALDTHPIYSPWEGAARMADALVGNITQARQAQAQNAQSQFRANEYRGMFGGQGGDPTVPSADSSPPPGAVSQNEKDAIAANESGGNYAEIGPHVPETKTHPAGYALGKYQVMNYDLPDRLKSAGLPAMSEGEFLANHDAQEKQFDHEFGGLRQTHSFADAASMWHSGVPLDRAIKEGRTDGYMTTGDYVKKALQHLNPVTPAGAAAGGSTSMNPSPNERVPADFAALPSVASPSTPQTMALGNPAGPQTPMPMPRPPGMGPGAPAAPPPAAPPAPGFNPGGIGTNWGPAKPPVPAPAAPPAAPAAPPPPPPPPPPQAAAQQPEQPPATGQPIKGTMSPAEREHIFNLISHPATQAEGIALMNELIKPKPEDMITGQRYMGTPAAGYRPTEVPTTPVEQPGGLAWHGIGAPLLAPGSRGNTPYGANVSPRGQAPQQTAHGLVNGKGYPVHEDGSIDQERLHGWITQGWRPPQ